MTYKGDNMNTFFKSLIIIVLTLFTVGCSSKVTIKRLEPSKIETKKIRTVFVTPIQNDRISQEVSIREELLNANFQEKKLFFLKQTEKNSDAIIKADILQSSLNYRKYYEEYQTNTCISYDPKSKQCLDYEVKNVPCEERTYKVRTNIEVINPTSKNVLFGKTYTQTKIDDKCYEFFYNHFINYRKKQETNTQLAKMIAYDFVKDISPKFASKEIEIIEEIQSIKVNEAVEVSFKKAVELLEKQKIVGAKRVFKQINNKIEKESWEVFYNLALTHEALNELDKALSFYKKAQNIVDKDSIDRVLEAIKRVKQTQKMRKKALFQLS